MRPLLRGRTAIRFPVLLAAALAAAVGAAPAAQAAPAAGAARAAQASAQGWHLTASVGPVNGDTYVAGGGDEGSSAAAMISGTDAWVLGNGCPDDSTCDTTLLYAEHWNGHSWKQLLPTAQRGSRAFAIGASSASNAWLFGWGNSHTALHWNGHSWSARTLPSWVLRINRSGTFEIYTSVFSASNVWVFSGGTGAYAAHWNGRSWAKVRMPAIPYEVSAVSAKDIWALGSAGPMLPQKLVVMHWNGRSWRTVTSPGGLSITTGFGSLTAISAANVWAARNRSGGTSLLHWNGKRWRYYPAPKGLSELNNLASDGHGGLWAAGSGPKPKYHSYLYHRSSGGRWSAWTAHPPAGTTLQELDSVYRLPGTRSMLATGQYLPPGGEAVVGAIWQYGG